MSPTQGLDTFLTSTSFNTQFKIVCPFLLNYHTTLADSSCIYLQSDTLPSYIIKA
jgi:hypothetical protein